MAANGGGVIGSYEAGMYDTTGQRSPADDFAELFSVQYGDAYPLQFDVYMQMAASHNLPVQIPEGKRIPTIGMQVGVESDGAQVVAQVQGASEVHYGPLGDAIGPPTVLTHELTGGGRSVGHSRRPNGGRGDDRGKLQITSTKTRGAISSRSLKW